jgi:hypothetical protein
MTVVPIAECLAASSDDVRGAHRMLDLPVNGTMEPVRKWIYAEREAAVAR